MQQPRAEDVSQLPVTFSMAFSDTRVASPETSNWTCVVLAIRGDIMPEHRLAIADRRRGRTAIAHQSPPRRRLLVRADHLIRI